MMDYDLSGNITTFYLISTLINKMSGFVCNSFTLQFYYTKCLRRKTRKRKKKHLQTKILNAWGKKIANRRKLNSKKSSPLPAVKLTIGFFSLSKQPHFWIRRSSMCLAKKANPRALLPKERLAQRFSRKPVLIGNTMGNKPPYISIISANLLLICILPSGYQKRNAPKTVKPSARL